MDAALKKLIDESEKVVFFGGAGVSTESGIPDFRGVDGLYHQKYDYPPETILSHDFFFSHTEEFYRFYRDKMLCLDAQPNPAHLALARLEEEGRLTAASPRTSTGCTSAPAASGCSSCTAACCATTVCAATARSG